MDLPDDLESALPAWRKALQAILPQLPPRLADRLRLATDAAVNRPGKNQAQELLEAIYEAGSPAVYTAVNGAVWLLSHARVTAGWSARDMSAYAIARFITEQGAGRVACDTGTIWLDQALFVEPLLDLETDPSGRWIGQEDDTTFSGVPNANQPRRAFARALARTWSADDTPAWIHCRGRLLAVPAIGIPADKLARTAAGERLRRAVYDTVMQHPAIVSPNQRPWWTGPWSDQIAQQVVRAGITGPPFRGMASWLRSVDYIDQMETALFAFAPHLPPCANIASALRRQCEEHLGDLLKDLGAGWSAYAWEGIGPRTSDLPILINDQQLESPLYPLAGLIDELVIDGTLPPHRNADGSMSCSAHAALRGGLVHLSIRSRLWLVAPLGYEDPASWYVAFTRQTTLPSGWGFVPDRLAWDAYVTPCSYEAA